jgi:hypothetical protein
MAQLFLKLLNVLMKRSNRVSFGSRSMSGLVKRNGAFLEGSD